MRSTSAILLSLLPLLPLVHAAPAEKPVFSRADPTAVLVPGSAQKCDIDDSACECSGTGQGDMQYLCGYVDPNWHIGAKPSKERRQAPQLPAGPPPAVLNVTNPLFSAMNLLELGGALQGAKAVIRNRVPLTSRGKFVQGLKGHLTVKSWLSGEAFDVGDAWEIRWDFAWFAAGGALPPTKLFGAHVEVLVQNKLGGKLHAAFFPQADDAFRQAPQQGDFYFEHVLDPLRKTAQCDPATQSYVGGEISAVRAIVASWIKARGVKAPPPTVPYFPPVSAA